MKKIISLFAFLTCLMFSPIFAQENVSMPTDEEIMQTIKKYNFDENQQNYLFKETKKKLQEIYSIEQESAQETIKPSQTATYSTSNKRTVKSEKSSMERKKKYTSHQPLTRRSENKD